MPPSRPAPFALFIPTHRGGRLRLFRLRVLFCIGLVCVVAAHNAARYSAEFTVARHRTSRSADNRSLDATLSLRTRGKVKDLVPASLELSPTSSWVTGDQGDVSRRLIPTPKLRKPWQHPAQTARQSDMTGRSWSANLCPRRSKLRGARSRRVSVRSRQQQALRN